MAKSKSKLQTKLYILDVPVEEGQVDIACHPQEDSEVWAADKCPCDDSGMVPAGAGGGRGPIIGDVGTGQSKTSEWKLHHREHT